MMSDMAAMPPSGHRPPYCRETMKLAWLLFPKTPIKYENPHESWGLFSLLPDFLAPRSCIEPTTPKPPYSAHLTGNMRENPDTLKHRHLKYSAAALANIGEAVCGK